MSTPPTRESTTTGWPSFAPSPSAMRRDATSLPPAAPAVSRRIGRVGYWVLDAAPAEAAASAIINATMKRDMNESLPSETDRHHTGIVETSTGKVRGAA